MVEQLKAAYKSTLHTLASAIGLRDQSTYAHVSRVNAYAQVMAKELGWPESRLETLEYGAILHDIGKLDVPKQILIKKEPLSAEEWKEMRRHPEYGASMIKKIDYLAPALPIVLYHHEAWDGSGYPEGLKGDEIPEEARLLAVVNSFDIMTSDQPYRPALAANDAFDEIMRNSGSQFDPNMVESFRRCWDRGDIHALLSGSQ
jgi:putative nucleotidyltransferase with HDIG domain